MPGDDCRHPWVPGASFCVNCGSPVGTTVPLTQEAGDGLTPRTASRYVTHHSPTHYVYAPDLGRLTETRLPLGAVLSNVLPLRPRLDTRALDRRHWVFLAFAAAPFVILRATDADADIERAAWGFAIYFGAVWLLVMHALIRPERIARSLLALVSAFTVLVGVAIAITVEELLEGGGDGFLDMVLRVGLPEEVSKVLPVALFMALGGVRRSPRAFLFVGALSGITFGVTEAVLYTTLYDDLAGYLGASTTITTIWRLVCGGLVHGCLSGVAAFFVGLAAWHRDVRPVLLVLGIGVPALLHGAYNASSSSWLGVVFAGAIAALFVTYVTRGDDMALALSSLTSGGAR